MRKILLALVLAVSVSVCAGGFQSWSNAWNVLTGASVTPQVVSVAGNTFDSLEIIATNYLSLPKCGKTRALACRDPGVTKKLIPAVRSGRVARNNLEQFFKDHPGQLGPTGLYDALQTAINTLQSVITTNHIGG